VTLRAETTEWLVEGRGCALGDVQVEITVVLVTFGASRQVHSMRIEAGTGQGSKAWCGGTFTPNPSAVNSAITPPLA